MGVGAHSLLGDPQSGQLRDTNNNNKRFNDIFLYNLKWQLSWQQRCVRYPFIYVMNELR